MCAKMQLNPNKLKQSKVDYLCFWKKKSSQPTSVYFLMVAALAKEMTVKILIFWVAIDNCDIVCHFLHARLQQNTDLRTTLPILCAGSNQRIPSDHQQITFKML